MIKKINVAVTVNYKAHIWSNGANQHCFFLYQLFKNMDEVENVWIVYDIDPDEVSPDVLVGQFQHDICHIDEVIDQVDLLVEMGTYISAKNAEIVRERDGKLVSYKFGNDYVMFVESFALGAHKGWVPHPQRISFDEVWTNAQHVNTCYSFFEHLYKAPVVVLPHLWAPNFLEEAIKLNQETASGWPFKGLKEKTPISVFEPNINVVKCSAIPFFAASAFYDKHPEAVSNIYLTNTLKLLENPIFTQMVASTEAGKKGVASAEQRHPFVDFVGKYGGIVLCHQWENGLNYIYYEALYGGFPLVHNSPFLKDVGYYYSEFDIDSAALAIEQAWTKHNENMADYRNNALDFLTTISPHSPSVIGTYRERVADLFRL